MALGESNPARLRALGTSPAALSKNEYGEGDDGGDGDDGYDDAGDDPEADCDDDDDADDDDDGHDYDYECYSEDAGEDDNDEEDACVPRCSNHIHVRRAATPWTYENLWLHRHHCTGGDRPLPSRALRGRRTSLCRTEAAGTARGTSARR